LPATLLESELFGYEKGSFTGALDTKIGLIEYARGGSLFLDEIGETSLAIQVKLLRALQEKEIKRVGGLEDIAVDVRFIAATSRDLEEEVRKERFREDLYYRLNVILIPIPPLRERKDDIPLLVDYFISVFNDKLKKTYRITPEAQQLLCSYNWPGNVRELENTIERILTLTDNEEITVRNIKECWGKHIAQQQSPATSFASALKRETESVEKEMILKVLEETQGNKLQAAKKLNISRQNLHYKLKKYGL